MSSSLISVAQGIVAVPADASVITGTVGIGQGGTGQTTAAAALTALGAGGGSTILTPTISGGTISGATITGETVSGGTITNPTLSGTITLATATITGGATMVGTYSGGTHTGLLSLNVVGAVALSNAPTSTPALTIDHESAVLGTIIQLTNSEANKLYWRIGCNLLDNNTLQIIPSTAGGGTTFAIPCISAQGGGQITLGGRPNTGAFVAAPTTNQVNWAQVTGSISGATGGVLLSAQGADTNVPITVTPKGNSSLISTNSLRVGNTLVTTQGAPSAKTTSTTLTAAEVLSGIVTANQGGAGAATYTMPQGTTLAAGLPSDFPNNGAFTFSLVNISANIAETATLATNTGITLVGGMTVISNSAAGVASSAPFLVRQTAANTFSVYRMG